MSNFFSFIGIGTKEIVTAIGTLFATFIGAWFAFQFARLQRDRERVEKEVVAGNRAIYTLWLIYSETSRYQQHVVEPVRGKPDAWVDLRMATTPNAAISLDTHELSFLLQSDPDVFQKVLLEEIRFKYLVRVIEGHRLITETIALPRFEAAGFFKTDQERSTTDIENVLGPVVAGRLKSDGEYIIKACDLNVASVMEAISTLRTTLNKMYPKRYFMNLEPAGPGQLVERS